MTSVFEVLPTKGILQTEEMTLDTSQNEHKETIARIKKKDESISRRCFLICQTCFWCASYIDITGNMDELPYKACPTCNDNRIESLPISYDERYHFEYTATMRVVV
ncbi:MAG: hypothetical protein WA667_27265 [Candidatus Nitrosopolaris sp.]